MYILDTDIVINFLRGEEKIKQLVYNFYTKNTCITFITLSELFFGAYNSKYTPQHLKEINFLTDFVDVLHPDFNACKLFGKIKSELKNSGKIIGDFDIMIAAIAIANDFILVTNNIKHYSTINELKLYKS